MTDKQLRGLSRTQLYELLHQQETEIDRLNVENAKLSEQKLSLEQAGSLAEASIVVSGIIQSAQSAADVYLESVRNVEANKVEEIARLEEDAKARALQAVEIKNAEAKAQMERLVLDMIRNFDKQVNTLVEMKEELSGLISRNDLKHLIPGESRVEDE